MQSSTENIQVVLKIVDTMVSYQQAHGGLPADTDGLEDMAVAIVEALERDDFRIVDILSGRRTEPA
ncbi:hypothetical protein ACFWXO_05375 [Kitasatospora sp. NPDC059088]|uniref:hypothetical protein n=1 Tax=Kitasatospora sp. NPDC059088 TaxID=3346722 RepID=UPI0036754E40